jgi:phosphohistidine swiveling domain-containing protein
MDKVNIKDWVFEFQQRGQHPVLMADFWCRALKFKYPNEIGFDFGGFDYLMTSENKGYYRKGQREEVLLKFKNKLENDNEYFDYILNQTKKRADEIKNYLDKGEFDWDNFSEIVLNFIPWFYIPWYITEFNYFSDKVVLGLKKYESQISSITDLNNSAMLLMFPDAEMDFQKEQEMLYEFVLNLKNNGKIDSQKYISEFGWMSTFIFAPLEPITEEMLVDKINKAIADKFDETYSLQKDRKAQDLIIKKKIEEIISEDVDLLKNIKRSKDLAWLLTWSVETVMKSFSQAIPFYKKIANDIGLKYDDWSTLTINEIKNSLINKESVVSREEIEERKKGFVLSIVDGEVSVVSGDEAVGIISKLNIEQNSKVNFDITEIKGKPASPGKVTGRVKICSSASESVKVESGDILVTTMTTPDYVSSMKVAGAIVTNEGGLLCHAAIISRELGKPCVIGTKIATQVLKDGDMVEVDADNGVVRIIN